MPRKTKRTPRVQLTLSAEAMALLDEISGLLEQPKASLVSELVDSALPALQTTVQALRVIKEQPRQAQQLIQNFGAQAVGDLMQAQLELDASIDKRTVKGKRARRSSGTT